MSAPTHTILSVQQFLKDFIYLFSERGEGREKERERNINVWLPLACPPQENLAYGQGMCLNWESNQWPFDLQASIQSTEPQQLGLSVQQFLKSAWTPCPTLPIHPILPQATFFFVSPDEKSHQREMLCWCGTGETKNDKSTERHQNRWDQKLFWAVKKQVSIGILHQMESTLKVTEVRQWLEGRGIMVERRGRDLSKNMDEWPTDMDNSVGDGLWEWGVGWVEESKGQKVGQL